MGGVLTLNDSAILDQQTSAEAQEVANLTHEQDDARILLRLEDRTFPLGPHLQELLLRVIEQAASGGTLTVRSMPEELTTTAAASFLGISRPTLMKKIRAGEIESRKVGTHTRISFEECIRVRDSRKAERQAAFDRMREIDDLIEKL